MERSFDGSGQLTARVDRRMESELSRAKWVLNSISMLENQVDKGRGALHGSI